GRRRRLADPGPDPPFPPRTRAADQRAPRRSAGSRRMSLLAAFAGLALAVQEPAPWAASPPPRTPESMITTMERYRFMTDCEMGQDWSFIRALYDTRIGSPEEQAILRRISGEGGRITGGDMGNDCTIADRMRLTSMLLRGGIAESRYRYVYASGTIPPANADIAPVA